MWQPLIVLIGLVALLEAASRHPRLNTLFRWLPIPLWCYMTPMLFTAAGWLPARAEAYGWVTANVFPVALALLLLGTDVASVRRLGSQALLAMGIGAAGILCAGPVIGWLLRFVLPPEGWKGIGLLAATWTGGSINMLALRTVLEVPTEAFAPLIVVDALVAYGWMALLIASKGCEGRLNRWFRAEATIPPVLATGAHPQPFHASGPWGLAGLCVLGIGLTLACRWAAQGLPRAGLVSSVTGWTVLLVTTAAVLLSFVPPIRRLGTSGAVVGYPCLYLVLASLGAQASPGALLATPVWVGVGLGMLAGHALTLAIGGRVARIPWAVLATASQANVGGVVSAPLVGAVYHQHLAPIGLLLALAGNALGTYLGLAAATVSRWLTG